MPPKVVTEQEVQATLASAGGSAARAGAAAGGGGASPASAAPAPRAGNAGAGAGSGSGQTAPARTLPKTASSLPLFGLATLLALTTGLALTMRRRFVQ